MVDRKSLITHNYDKAKNLKRKHVNYKEKGTLQEK